jgi:hypothetical protein
MNVHAKIGIVWSSDGNRENGHSFIFHTKREFYVLHVLGSEFVRKSRLYVLEMRSLLFNCNDRDKKRNKTIR